MSIPKLAYSTGNSQDWHLEIDLDFEGEASVREAHSSENGVPASYWHGRGQRIRLGATALTQEQADEICAAGNAVIAAIQTGYSCEWNGSNHVGSLTDEANDEILAFEQRVDEGEFPGVTIWEPLDVLEWDELDEDGDSSQFFTRVAVRTPANVTLGTITAVSTDEELKAIAAAAAENCSDSDYGYVEASAVLDQLECWRDECEPVEAAA